MPLKPQKIKGLWLSPAMTAANRIPKELRCQNCDNFQFRGSTGTCLIRKFFSTDVNSSCSNHSSYGVIHENDSRTT